MKPVEFANAGTLSEAAEQLRDRGGAAKVFAGNTDLLSVLRDRVHRAPPELIVNLKTIPGLDRIETDGEDVVIGALTTLHDVEADPIIRSRYPLLAEAARAVASPELRNMGTVGGNLCQEPRCWYYRYPNNYFDCTRKGGVNCEALTGENRFHSIFGSTPVVTRPCTGSCPCAVEIPEYMERLRAGDVVEASRILLDSNALPAITGRVCPHACEERCNRNLWDEAVSVREIERWLGDYVLDHSGETMASSRPTGKAVAIIGGGPAGLSCAFYLRTAGHPVTVFERMPEAGGLLRYGIPGYRLSTQTVRRQIAALHAMDIEFRLGVEVGKDIDWEELRVRYAAVFLATGAWGQPEMGIEREELLLPGLPFLREVKEGVQRSVADRVIVVGGGNVAVDVALTAKRLGAAEVTMVCLERDEEMPALDWEVAQARAVGVRILPSWGPARILVDNGRLAGLELVRCSCVFDETGRFDPTYDRDVTSHIEADQVFLAIGQRPDLGPPALDGDIRASANWIAADQDTQETSAAGIYAGGDVVSGPSTVISAMAAGRRGAEAIIRYLGGSTAVAAADVSGLGAPLNSFNSGFLLKTPRAAAGERQPGGATLTSAELDQEERTTVLGEQMENEANRCFNCGCVAVTASDLAPVLVALEAQIRTTQRLVPAATFFGVGIDTCTVLAPDELVQDIRLPALPRSSRQAFRKFRIRNTIDFPIVNVATVLSYDAGRVAEARVVMGAVAPVPVRAGQAEAYLVGKALTPDTAREAAELAVSQCMPLSRNAYKVSVLRALVARALAGAVEADAS